LIVTRASDAITTDYGRGPCDHMVVEFTTTYEISQWLTLQVQIPLRRGVLDTTLYDKICQ